jgi:hypothetical protein
MFETRHSLPAGLHDGYDNDDGSGDDSKIRGWWQLYPRSTQFIPDYSLTKRRSGTTGGLARASLLYRSVDGPGCESEAAAI